jgi:hypothetical protein
MGALDANAAVGAVVLDGVEDGSECLVHFVLMLV